MENIKNELVNGNTLTDEQIEEIVEVLHPKETDGAEEPKHFPYAVLNKEGKLEKGVAQVCINEDGTKTILGPVKDNDVTLDDILEGKEDEVLNKIPENVSEGLTELGLSMEDSMTLYNIILRDKKGEKFNVYNEFPKALQEMTESLVMSKNPKLLKDASRELLKFLSNQLSVEQEFVDLQSSIQKELAIPGVMDMYNDHLAKTMQDDLLNKAKEIEATHPDKAETLRTISNTYTKSLDLTDFHHEIDSNPSVVKKIRKNLKKFNKECRDFNFKYQNSKFKINSVSLLESTILRQVNCTKEEAQKIILLFTHIARDMKSDNIIEHTFMYYTIKNILSLDHIDKDDNEFKINLVNSLNSLLEKIRNIEGELV